VQLNREMNDFEANREDLVLEQVLAGAMKNRGSGKHVKSVVQVDEGAVSVVNAEEIKGPWLRGQIVC
jgi:hypothetical protein